MRVGGHVVDGRDGVFKFFSRGRFAGNEAAEGALDKFLGVI